jgi:hypothetical protein
MGDSIPPGKSTKPYGNPWVFYESDLQPCWVSISISMLIYRGDLEFASISNWRVKKRKHGNFNMQTPEVCPRTGPTFGQHSTNIIPKR